MTITTKPVWVANCRYRGVIIYRRQKHTGTSGGKWLAGGTYFDTRIKAVEYLNGLPIGQRVSANETVGDE